MFDMQKFVRCACCTVQCDQFDLSTGQCMLFGDILNVEMKIPCQYGVKRSEK
jgi:hypothetical protein